MTATSRADKRTAGTVPPRDRGAALLREARMPAVVAVVLVIALAWAHTGLEPQTITIAAASYVLLAAGFNLVAGYGGRLVFGNTIFFGLGAYTVAAGDAHGWFPAIVGLVIAMAIAAPVAYGLSRALQKSAGLIFALITFTMSIMLDELVSLGGTFGGSQGLEEPLSEASSVTGLELSTTYAYAVAGCILVLITIVAARLLVRSSFGKQVIATRDEPLAAEAAGINTAHVTGLMWAASAVLTTIAGIYYTQANGFIDPDSAFGLNTAVTMVAAAVIGGLGTMTGPLIGGVILGASLLLNNLPVSSSVPGLNELAYGAVLIVVARLLPGGIVGTCTTLIRRRWPRKATGGAPAGSAGPAGRGAVLAAGGAGPALDEAVSPAADEALLEVRGLTMMFGGLKALSGVDLTIRRGEIVGLVGPNGAGKTTLFNCINGSLRPSGGQVVLRGRRVERLPAFARARAGLGRTFQITRVFRTMTAFENVAMPYIATSRKEDSARLVSEIAALLEIEDLMNLPAGSLSIVDQRRVELARAVAAGSTMVMLDEPTAGLDDDAARTVGEAVRLINAAFGVTFVIVEHVMGRLAPIAHRIVVMEFGQIIADGTPEAVLAEEVVARAYLGAGKAAAVPAGQAAAGGRPVVRAAPRSAAGEVPALAIRDLRTGYGGHTVLHGVDVEIPPASCLGIIGPNGAGKTTLLRAISGETRLYSGEIRVGDTPTAGMRVADIVRELRVAHVVEGRGILRGMTVEDNLRLGSHDGAPDFDAVGAIFPRLVERLGQRAETMSGGELQMLAIARALMMKPALLLLDEPSQGLSPKFVEDVFTTIHGISRSGVTTIVVEQVPGLLGNVADTIAFMAGGKLSRQHPLEALNDAQAIARLLAEGVIPE
jgi:ABC-type branched-subunit amino acid transport system ATPase component/ABC-type branched-subunit amino acid transport system permease subunit